MDRRALTRRIVKVAILTLAFVSGLSAISHREARESVVRFIDFYIAAPPVWCRSHRDTSKSAVWFRDSGKIKPPRR